MPVPSSINDLSTIAGSNSPAGSESPGLIDDYLRVQASFIAILRDNMNSFIGSLSASGYIKIPVVVAGVNRTFILQWNNIAAAGTSGVLVNYPIAFPNAVLGNLATTSIVAGPLTQYVACSAATTTNVYVVSNSGTPSVMLVSFGY